MPLFDFGKANVRGAEQRYLEAANRLGLGVNAPSEAREAYGAYRATFARRQKYEAGGAIAPAMPAKPSCYNAMQIDAFALLKRRGGS